MKNIVFIVILVSLRSCVTAQLNDVKSDLLNSCHEIKNSTYKDSIIIDNQSDLCCERFTAIFHRLLVDKKHGSVRVIGKVIFAGGDTIGVPGVFIFKAKRDKDRFINIDSLGESSRGNRSVDKFGYFDINFKIDKDESLFFYLPQFFLEEYKFCDKVWKVLFSK